MVLNKATPRRKNSTKHCKKNCAIPPLNYGAVFLYVVYLTAAGAHGCFFQSFHSNLIYMKKIFDIYHPTLLIYIKRPFRYISKKIYRVYQKIKKTPPLSEWRIEFNSIFLRPCLQKRKSVPLKSERSVFQGFFQRRTRSKKNSQLLNVACAYIFRFFLTATHAET